MVKLAFLTHRCVATVATVNLGTTLDLERIAQVVSNAEYNPRRFGAVIMRIREPRTTALVFKSGKMVVTGAKDTVQSQTACKKYTAIIQKVGFDASFRDFKIQNISGTCDAGFPIKLEGLLYAHAGFSTYEPEIFPGLIYRLPDPKVVFLVFVSGKVVITGAKTEDAMAVAFDALYPILTHFRKESVVSVRR